MGNHRASSKHRGVLSEGTRAPGPGRADLVARRAYPRAGAVARAVARLAAEEEGQAVLEYILILAATVIGAGLMSQKILQAIDSGILSLGGQLEKDLKTGRAPLDIWKN